jgi:peptidoglycan/xylan/chitin deacetylase (PgdA/CDA1 family)
MQIDRRGLLILAAGTAAALAGCSEQRSRPGTALPLPGRPTTPALARSPRPSPFGPRFAVAAARPLPPIPPARPGPPHLVERLPRGGRGLALTIDDGFDPETVAAYVRFAQDSGIAVTFGPNGAYAGVWQQHAAALRPLIEAGQVQIQNHTFSHRRMTRLSDALIRTELERNEDWIQRTFGTTARPWWRPPFGLHNEHTDSVAAGLGSTRTLMWNGSLGDARLLTPQVLLQQAGLYVRPGTVLLGHANHPTVTHLYGQLVELIRSRELTPQTLDQAFGTSRATG